MIKRALSGLFVAISGVIVAAGLSWAPRTSGLLAAEARRTLPKQSQQVGYTLPRVSNGYLVSYSRTALPNSKAAIRLTALATGATEDRPVRVPGISAIRIDAAVVASDSSIIAVGTYARGRSAALRVNRAAKAPGAGVAPKAEHGLFQIGRSGEGRVLVSFDDYAAVRVCSQTNGDIWTFGQYAHLADRARGKFPRFLVRHYGPTGRLVQEHLPAQLVGQVGAQNYHAVASEGAAAFLACGDRSVVAYVARTPVGSGGFVLARIDSATGTERHELVRNPPGVRLTGLEIAGTGTLVASFAARPAGGNDQRTPARRWGTAPEGIYELNPAERRLRKWKRRRTAGTLSSTAVVGRDGQSLVLLKRGDTPELFWVPAKDVSRAR